MFITLTLASQVGWSVDLRRRVVVKPVCPIVLLVLSLSSSFRHSLSPWGVARALLRCAFLPLLDLSEPEPSKLEGCWIAP